MTKASLDTSQTKPSLGWAFLMGGDFIYKKRITTKLAKSLVQQYTYLVEKIASYQGISQ